MLDIIAFFPPGVFHQLPNQHTKQRNSPYERGNQVQDLLQFLSVMRGLQDAEVRKDHLPKILAEPKDTGEKTRVPFSLRSPKSATF